MPSPGRSSLVVMLILHLAGCGESSRHVGRLSGTVSYDEQPMAEGTIVATNQDCSMTVETTIIDGKYSFAACPLGEVRLVVVPPGPGRNVAIPERPDPEVSSRLESKLPSAKKGTGVKTLLTQRQKENQQRYQHFPSAYRQFDKTPLRTTVQSGDNVFPLALRSKS